MRILVAGGSGLIGRALVHYAAAHGHAVIALSRAPERLRATLPPEVDVRPWSTNHADAWSACVGDVDAVVNLSGESIGAGRWTAQRKQRILSSRIDSTRALVAAIRSSRRRPEVLINASAVGFYGNVDEAEVTESQKMGGGFLAEVCGAWEREAMLEEESGVRVVLLRSGLVLDRDGGALAKMARPFFYGAGAVPGTGMQWVSWIHRTDEIAAIEFLLAHSSISGPVNLSAPTPVRMKDFSHALASAIHRPCMLRIPPAMLRVVLGEMAEMILEGQRVMPTKLTENGFRFSFPSLQPALADLFGDR